MIAEGTLFIVKTAGGTSDQYSVLLDRYHQRPSREKEQYAHSYAERTRQHLTATNMLPFDRQLDREQLQRDNVLVQDFELPRRYS